MEITDVQINRQLFRHILISIVFVLQCWSDVLAVPCNSICTTCDRDSAGHVVKVVCTGVDIPSIPDSVQEMYLSDGTVSRPGIFKDYVFIGKTDLHVIHMKKYGIKMVWESPFINLTDLIEVDLSYNDIQDFDKSNLAGPVALRVLKLSHNKIQQINDDAFVNQTSLKELYMSVNKVTQIPANAFRGLRSLEHLDLSYNLLTTISSQAFHDCSALRILSLRGNRLDTVAPHLFQGLSHLQSVNLQRNRLFSIGQDAFVGTNITFLDMSRNRLHDVRSTMAVLKTVSGENVEVVLTANLLNVSYGPGVLSGVTVKLLDLQYNGITTFPQDTFANNHIRNLKLAHNNLKSLPSSMEAYLAAVKPNITLDHNPWQCDCRLLWFSKYLNQLSPPDLGTRLQSTLQCSAPSTLQNILIQNIATIIESGCKTTIVTATGNYTSPVANITATRPTPAVSLPVQSSPGAGKPGLGPISAPSVPVTWTTWKMVTSPGGSQTVSGAGSSVPTGLPQVPGGIISTGLPQAPGSIIPTGLPQVPGGTTSSGLPQVLGGMKPTGLPGGTTTTALPQVPGGMKPTALPQVPGGMKPIGLPQVPGGISTTGMTQVPNSTLTTGLTPGGTSPVGLNSGNSQGESQRTTQSSDNSFPIGAVVGPLAALCLIGGAIGWFLYRKKSKGTNGRVNSNQPHEPEETDYLWGKHQPITRSLGPSKTYFNSNSLNSFYSYQGNSM
ncbi:leucine-rich repeat-containing protein 4B-like [Mizuhopecten yessoensis]|uniref:leucine-rich repeat-containing protein 4B-like n=1 Tax=Mizuhopecten yessoensis TaxID=6573 RepID=UPI000B45CF0F|nr:leucine-rich repeat-containing protein 4B-like [Mizuhopecten yessoensis]